MERRAIVVGRSTLKPLYLLSVLVPLGLEIMLLWVSFVGPKHHYANRF